MFNILLWFWVLLGVLLAGPVALQAFLTAYVWHRSGDVAKRNDCIGAGVGAVALGSAVIGAWVWLTEPFG